MAVFAATYGTPHRHGFLRWLISTFGVLILVLVFEAISQLNQSGPVSCTPPQCHVPPPQQGALPAPDRYTSSQYGFSLDYSPNIPPSQQTGSSISWSGTLSDGSDVSWTVGGEPANGKSPQQIVSAAQNANFPDAQAVYTIPGAELGYTAGYGMVYDVSAAPDNGQSVHDRMVVVAAIRGSLAVVLVGLGPYQSSSPSSDSHPNPAATPLVDLGEFEEAMNTVTWPSEASL